MTSSCGSGCFARAKKKTLMRKKELVLLGLEHKFLNYFGKLLPTRWLNANLWPALLTRESHFA